MTVIYDHFLFIDVILCFKILMTDTKTINSYILDINSWKTKEEITWKTQKNTLPKKLEKEYTNKNKI